MMNASTTATPELPVSAQDLAPSFPVSRLWYWSLRRELWENRSIYVVPLIVAGLSLFGFFISTFRLPAKLRGLAALDPEQQRIAVASPFSLAASMILFSGVVVSFFYCLDALSGERRDRSILFWKSLPVSDRATVLSKASIPLFVQPLLGYVIAHVVQLLMLFGSTVVALASGQRALTLWGPLPIFQMPLVMFYGLAVHALWYAPLYAWLLLVSSWARRATFLWAILPLVAVMIVERAAFGTTRFAELLKYRFMGAMIEAFQVNAALVPITRLSQLDPLRFLSSPGLWIGLLLAAAFLAAAVRLRRNREPN